MPVLIAKGRESHLGLIGLAVAQDQKVCGRSRACSATRMVARVVGMVEPEEKESALEPEES